MNRDYENQPLDNTKETSLLMDSRIIKSPYNLKLLLTILVPLALGFGAGILVWGLAFPMSTPREYVSSSCAPPESNLPAKNLIFLVGDGFGPSSATLTRVMLNRTLSFDEHFIGTIRTYSSNSLVTDSAAAATAMACGIKTKNTYIAVDDDGVAVGTILEAAIAAGLSAGVIVTDPVCQATPACFTSHSISRDLMEFIAYQQILQKMDIILGGGLDYFQALDNLALNKAVELGYNIIYDKYGLETAKLPVLGLFAPDDTTYMIDREPSNVEPSLSEMVSRAFELLTEQANPNGFMLMIEGSRIDHGEHDNDPVAAYHEAIEFEKTFKLVTDFARSRGDTLVLSTADHETGGLGLARDGIYSFYPDILNQVTKSVRFLEEVIQNSPNESTIIFENYTSFNLTQDEIDQIDSAKYGSYLKYTLSDIISKRTLIGWTTIGHTAVDVNLYGYGPHINKFCGNSDNSDLVQKILTVFPSWNIEAITEKLKDFDTSGNNFTSVYH